jgi:hypothetical protein
MNISNVASSTTGPYSPGLQPGFKQRAQDFKALSNALQSGDLSGAQQALTAFQQDVQNVSKSSPWSQLFGQNTQAGNDLKTLQNALQSGDLTGAQQAFASLKQDIQGVGHAHRGHHHHKAEAENDGDADDGAQSSSATSNPTANPTVSNTLDTQA